MFGSLIDYWFYTGDETYNDVTFQAMQHQVGNDRDYMPENQTSTLGNDDQGFWVMAAMAAAETNFRNPEPDQPQWLALAQAAFNEWVSRWDPATCGGGLRWQIFQFNSGFTYKNSISNGCFFNVAARLARFTGNQTYADWAVRVWDWMEDQKLIDEQYNVYDGAGVQDNCATQDKAQWTYNAGIYLQGAAVMYNFTEGQGPWQERLDGLVKRTQEYFMDDGVIVERACEGFKSCNIDQQSFRGYLMRWMASAAQVAPYAFDTIMPIIKTNAEAAAQQCSGSPDPELFKGVPGTACGLAWAERENYDSIGGVGQQMSAMSAIQYTLIRRETAGTVTADTGGTSVGDVNAGVMNEDKLPDLGPVSIGERVAAGFLTSAISLSVLGGTLFVMKE
jgi:mannan endo-1,6-alpha-mannosidase